MGRKFDLKQVDGWAKVFEVPRDKLSDYIHKIKFSGARKNPDLVVDEYSGDIYIKGTTEFVGNVLECLGR